MDSQVQKLFVYGTPLKSEARSINLKECELLKTSSIPGNLYTTKYEYPAAIFDINSKNKIFGELY
ncbi:MAG: gamma-glutamylcyclotransferase, partial [Nitrosopumilaceae archaeon]